MYWPKHIPGDVIIAHFNNKDVYAMDSLHGLMGGVHVHTHAMKKPDYTMMLMTTYGMLADMGDERK